MVVPVGSALGRPSRAQSLRVKDEGVHPASHESYPSTNGDLRRLLRLRCYVSHGGIDIRISTTRLQESESTPRTCGPLTRKEVAMSMETKERPVPNGIILELTGDLTFANREQFKTAVEVIREKGCRHLILNMAGVRFVDSSGLGLLALASQHFNLRQGTVSMVQPQTHVREIMTLANITQLIPVYDQEQDALAGCSP